VRKPPTASVSDVIGSGDREVIASVGGGEHRMTAKPPWMRASGHSKAGPAESRASAEAFAAFELIDADPEALREIVPLRTKARAIHALKSATRRFFRWNAEEACVTSADRARRVRRPHTCASQPAGVCDSVTPWNFRPDATRKIGPALAPAARVVLKPGPYAAHHAGADAGAGGGRRFRPAS